MPLWLAAQPLVLASRSAARRDMLERAGIPLELRAADIDERTIEREAAQDAGAIAEHLAEAKARAVSAQAAGRIVLGADQTLACEGRLFSKPESLAAAEAQLLALRGRTHTLHTAACVMLDGEAIFSVSDVARLTMRNFSQAFLAQYLRAVGDAACQSVGAYQLEGIGIQLFERVEGDFFTILGLPLPPVLRFFREAGYLAE